MKQRCAAVVLVLLLICIPVQSVCAAEVDILVEKLVQKGILTETDAREILQEVKEASRTERQKVVRETAEALRKENGGFMVDLPAWVRNTTFKGDLRLRYQFNDGSDTADRHRGRYRLRLGATTRISETIRVGFGLATGSSDPRSTNQSMGNSFETPDIRLDYAFAAWQPVSWLGVLGGKFKNPLWRPSDLLWDSDINPEGVAAQLNWKTGPTLDLFLNTGVWMLDERSGDENDPIMYVFQPGVQVHFGPRVWLKQALTLYEFDNVEGTVLDHTSGTNSLTRSGVLARDYDALAWSGELGVTTGLAAVPFTALFGDYVTNRRTSSDDDGWLLGWKVGHKKVRKKHQWQVKALYRRLERDAWPDIFPDSDAYGGQTNVKGFEGVLQYGLEDNVSLALDYYYMKRIRGKSRTENLLQVDMNVAF